MNNKVKNMKSLFSKCWQYKWIMRSLPYSIVFNFHYLPFKQAIYLPILFYKPKFLKLKGRVVIECQKVNFGMIKLGCFDVSLYPNTGIVFENRGTISFKGKCNIGNNSAISIGDTGKLIFGDHFCSTASLKIACYKEIIFGENVLCGWNCIFMDTDFHEISSLKDPSSTQCSIKEILIGDNCWFALNNTVMKGTILPSHSIVASNSLLNKDYSQEEPYSLFAGQPATVKKRGIALVR